MGLNEDELKRYNRRMMMEGGGEEILEKLKKSTVFIAGAGGLRTKVRTAGVILYLPLSGKTNI